MLNTVRPGKGDAMGRYYKKGLLSTEAKGKLCVSMMCDIS